MNQLPEHQTEAISRIRKCTAFPAKSQVPGEGRGTACPQPGSGETITAATNALECFPGGRILVTVPTPDLLAQTTPGMAPGGSPGPDGRGVLAGERPGPQLTRGAHHHQPDPARSVGRARAGRRVRHVRFPDAQWLFELGLSEAIDRDILVGFEIDVLEIRDPSPSSGCRRKHCGDGAWRSCRSRSWNAPRRTTSAQS